VNTRLWLELDCSPLMREIAEAGVNELIECGELKPKDAKDIVDSLVQCSEEKKGNTRHGSQ